MRTLFIDIETSPNVAYTWGLFNQNIGINQLVSTSRVLCFAAKWQGEKKVQYYGENLSRSEMVAAAHALLEEADVVVHYNGQQFDIPHLNREFLKAGLTPPAPFVQVDLLQVARKKFMFTSNKLDHVAQDLGLGAKVEHEGFGLWEKCLQGDPAAWKRMQKYNKQDVVLTEKLYDTLLPWIPGHPSHRLYDGGNVCPRCAAEGTLQRRGFSYTKVSKFQRWFCTSCGTWFRSSRRETGVQIQEAVL